MSELVLLNGPNLNLLGLREPEIYGGDTLADLEDQLTAIAKRAGHELVCFQSNSEGALIDKIHEHREAEFAICNLGAYTHTSIAIRDALLATEIPFIEVHISNVYARERFRHKSLFSDLAIGSIVGLGTYGYALAMQAVVEALDGHEEEDD